MYYSVHVCVQVVSHEACHLFGLDHCEYFHCNMNASGRVAQAMAQPLFLCPVCLRKLHRVSRINPSP